MPSLRRNALCIPTKEYLNQPPSPNAGKLPFGPATFRQPLQDAPWLVPNSNARHVLPSGSVATPAVGATAVALKYTVPGGRVFSLRGISIITRISGYIFGDGTFTFGLTVTAGGQVRNVDFLGALTVPLGNEVFPYRMGARLEFEQENILQGTVTNVGGPVGAPNFVTWVLWGHSYQQNER
jgi:hypothetical protein